jgi:alpha-tubulin suppressor-like RCC1 family protein
MASSISFTPCGCCGGTSNLRATGANDNGQIGDGTIDYPFDFETIGTSTWLKIAAGYRHSLGIKQDGTLWSWGLNGNGQLGLGDTTQRLVPTQVGSASDWIFIAAGIFNSIAIKSDGTMWQCGLNSGTSFSEIGVDTDWLYATWYTDALSNTIWHAIKTDGTLWNALGQVGSDTDWRTLAGGVYYQLMLIKTDGTLWGLGVNQDGELGVGDQIQRTSPTQSGTDTDWVSVSAGFYCTAAIKADGTLWTCGNNDSWQLGLGDNLRRLVLTQVGVLTTWLIGSECWSGAFLAIMTDGTIWGCGLNGDGELGYAGSYPWLSTLTQIGSATNWSYVTGGTDHTLALTT